MNLNAAVVTVLALVLAPQPSRATAVYDKALAQPGLNLVNGCSILDLDGRVLKTYPGDLCQYGPGGEIASAVDGAILSVFQKDLSPVMVKEMPEHREGIHHELIRSADGSFLLLSSEFQKNTAELNRPADPKAPSNLRYDVLYRFDRTGNVQLKWSTYDRLRDILKLVEQKRGVEATYGSRWIQSEFIHINSLQLLPHNRHEAKRKEFAAGNILFSDIAYKFMGIIDAKTLEIVWTRFEAADGLGQHAVRMLANGNILFFVNETASEKAPKVKYSRLVELDPASGKIVWEYVATPPESFFSQLDGHAQRLPNGNTLVTVNNLRVTDGVPVVDGTPGLQYAFEVTRGKKVVWRWEPKAGEAYVMPAQGLYRVERVSREKMTPFLDKP